MSKILVEYQKRLRKRRIQADDLTTLVAKATPDNLKFDAAGKIKPFYGLTCIAWVEQGSQLHRDLCDFQNAIKKKLQEAGVGDVFSFLKPESFHMTICDINASSSPIPSQEIRYYTQQIQNAFTQIEKSENINAQVRGVGLSTTITALVDFESEIELRKVLDLEQKIKQSTQVNVRNFAGHISLAYCVNSSTEKIKTSQELLFPNKDKVFGEFSFSKFDLTYFVDMNHFKPLLTVDVKNGQVIQHERVC